MNKQEELKATMEAQAAEARLLEMVRREVSDSEARIIRNLQPLLKQAADTGETAKANTPAPDKKPITCRHCGGQDNHSPVFWKSHIWVECNLCGYRENAQSPIKKDPVKPVPVENMAGMAGHADRSKLHRTYEITEDRLSELRCCETGLLDIILILTGQRKEFEIEDIVERVRKLHEVASPIASGSLFECHWINNGQTLVVADGVSRLFFTREEAGKIVKFLLNTRCEIRL